ncbi:hypothetical protein KAR91_85620 [Candidatus Pacearchaeota archaeon]|nr:hypothetical protein [Candidatus Pacearchaeota archaeon]
MNNAIDVYASKDTLESQGLSEHYRSHVIEPKKWITIGGFNVFPFEAIHDCHCYGYIIKCDGEYLLFCTDTKLIKQRFNIPFSIVMIESSYCGKTLKRKVESGEVNEAMARRLLESHLEIEETARYLREFCNLSKCHQLHLLHLSGSNNDRERCRKRFKDEFFIEVITVGKD